MTTFSLREAAEQAKTSKSTIWRAIKSGRMSATRTDDGGFSIDPAELFRVFQPEQPEQRPTGQDGTAPATASATPATDETALRLAALDAEVKGLRDLTRGTPRGSPHAACVSAQLGVPFLSRDIRGHERDARLSGPDRGRDLVISIHALDDPSLEKGVSFWTPRPLKNGDASGRWR